MKKSVIVVGLMIALAFSWMVGISNIMGTNYSDEIAYYEELAKQQYALEAYGSVIKYYEKIITLEDTSENRVKLADLYRKIENTGMYQTTMEECIRKHPQDAMPYEKLGEYYVQKKNYEDCVELLRTALNGTVKSDKLEKMYYETAYLFNYASEGYQEAYCFYDTISLVKKEDKYEYFRTKNSKDKKEYYEQATSITDSIAGVVKDNEAYYIDKGENKYLGTTEEYDKIWSMNEGMGVYQKGETYGYINSIFAKTLETYQYATSFVNGVAAVKQNKEWILLDTEGKKVGKKSYQEVLVDEDNFCSNQNRIFVNSGEGYYLIDTTGKKISKNLYEDAKPFFTEELTAVKVEGKWGFINKDGKVVIKPEYEDAKAFGYGIAPVKKDGRWGYITKSNRMVIAPQFEDAKSFTDNAMAPIKEAENWYYIKIYK